MTDIHLPLLFWIPAGVVFLYFGWRWVSTRPEREIRAHRLWRLPALLAAVILPLVYLQPHKPFRLTDYGIFAVALLMGLATGILRARAASLRYDHDSGRLMASFSLSAMALLIPLGIARHISRTYMGIGPEAASHGDARAMIGSLLFVLAMVVAHRGLLYYRARGVLPTRRKD
ncbi:MAG: hypothetical protein EP321_11445 [Sphingomonadales bacterium]|nr:MAG: hypothetical protein EP345_15710 [Sphingomonadales bacterium]TNF03138.1 MAG: hypothetical protein EP321_11445 [Sphingomonadales bacterium]